MTRIEVTCFCGATTMASRLQSGRRIECSVCKKLISVPKPVTPKAKYSSLLPNLRWYSLGASVVAVLIFVAFYWMSRRQEDDRRRTLKESELRYRIAQQIYAKGTGELVDPEIDRPRIEDLVNKMLAAYRNADA